jgi:hypothetical protein
MLLFIIEYIYIYIGRSIDPSIRTGMRVLARRKSFTPEERVYIFCNICSMQNSIVSHTMAKEYNISCVWRRSTSCTQVNDELGATCSDVAAVSTI